MKYIDIDSWPRKKHYQLFKGMDYPHFNLCANVDITELRSYIKDSDLSFFKSFLYIAVRTANEIPEFRYRIRDNKVVVHDRVDPSFTIMREDETFSFCHATYYRDFQSFYQEAEGKTRIYNENPTLKDGPGSDSLLFITSIPWLSFTSLTHPIHMNPVDSVPRIAWGKFFEENGKIQLPVSVQAHHALMDGLHVGRFFNLLQDYLDNPETFIHNK